MVVVVVAKVTRQSSTMLGLYLLGLVLATGNMGMVQCSPELGSITIIVVSKSLRVLTTLLVKT